MSSFRGLQCTRCEAPLFRWELVAEGLADWSLAAIASLWRAECGGCGLENLHRDVTPYRRPLQGYNRPGPFIQ